MRCNKCKCRVCSCIVNEQVKISVNKVVQNPNEKGIVDIKVPTKTSDLINDSGFGQGGQGDLNKIDAIRHNGGLVEVINKVAQIITATRTSQLTNDSNFTNKDYVDDQLRMYLTVAGAGLYTDIITPSSEVPTDVGDKVFLITQPGTYTNFGNVVLPENNFGFIFKNGNSFSIQSVEMPTIPINGKVEEGNTQAVSGGEVYEKLQKIKIGHWTAKEYTTGEQVIYDGKVYESNEAVISTDTPGTSSKWTEKIGTYVPDLDNLNETIESFPVANISSNYLLTVVIPSKQTLKSRNINKISFLADNKVAKIVAFSKTGTTNFEALREQDLVWNASKGYYTCNFDLTKDEYFGIKLSTAFDLSFKDVAGEGSDYYLQSTSISVGENKAFAQFRNINLWYKLNNIPLTTKVLDNEAKVNQNTIDIATLKSAIDNEVVGLPSSEWATAVAGGGATACHYNVPFSLNGIVTKIIVDIRGVGDFVVSVADDYKTNVHSVATKITLTATQIGSQEFHVNIPVLKGQFIGVDKTIVGGATLSYKFITGGFYRSFDAYNYTKAVALNNILQVDVDKKNANQTNAIEKAKYKLSPCMLYFDNFATEKNIKLYSLVGGSYVSGDTPAWINVGWVKSVEDTVMHYIRPTTAGRVNNSLTHQHTYTCENRKHRYMIKLEALDTVIRIRTNNVTVGEGDGIFEFDFATNKLSYKNTSGVTQTESTITFTPVVGKIYWIEVMRLSYACKISIQESTDLTVKSELLIGNGETNNYAQASGTGKFEIYLETGTPFKLYQYSVTTEGKDADLYITGDSITAGVHGYGATNSQRWASLVKAKVKSCVISARGTSNFNDVLWRLTSEVEFLRPKILLSANGFNGSVTQAYIDALATFCADRNIQLIQTMITGKPASLTTKNTLLASQNIQTVRMDLACRINEDITQDIDTARFPDSIHPNALGAISMANRVFVDIPQLVESFNK